MVIAIAGGCGRCGGERVDGDPVEVVGEVLLADPLLSTLDDRQLALIERHLRSSPRWEVRMDRGHVYAQRRQAHGGACGDCGLPGGFRTSWGGIYGDYPGQVLQATRVRLGLRGEPPEVRVAPLTIAKAGSGKRAIRATSPNPSTEGAPGHPEHTSWLRVTGVEGVYLEIMEQARAPDRRFTRSSLAQVHGELERVLQNAEVLEREGYVPSLWPEGASPPTGEPQVVLHPGAQPGMYAVTAWVNPREEGRAYVRVFHDGTGQALSEARITERTTELIGWSEEGEVLFPYQTDLVVDEGDPNVPFGARFELRFVNGRGEERTLATMSHTIERWTR